jgi:hypothetical protein
VRDCDNCGFQCTDCLIKNVCFACNGTNRIPDSQPNCPCESGFFHNTSRSDCQECDPNKCLTCVTTGRNCITCNPEFRLLDPPTCTCRGDRKGEYCACDLGKYHDALFDPCLDCDNTCLNCIKGECLECKGNRSPKLSDPMLCGCPTGFDGAVIAFDYLDFDPFNATGTASFYCYSKYTIIY